MWATLSGPTAMLSQLIPKFREMDHRKTVPSAGFDRCSMLSVPYCSTYAEYILMTITTALMSLCLKHEPSSQRPFLPFLDSLSTKRHVALRSCFRSLTHSMCVRLYKIMRSISLHMQWMSLRTSWTVYERMFASFKLFFMFLQVAFGDHCKNVHWSISLIWYVHWSNVWCAFASL